MPKRTRPLAPPPHQQSISRRKARRITTLFHQYTRERDTLSEEKDSSDTGHRRELNEKIAALESDYRQASQVSVSFFSTSKWVLGHLARNGWLYGIKDQFQGTRTRTQPRRPTRLLEIGAINTELLDTSERIDKNYNIRVRSLDLHSMHPRIEQLDFLTLPEPECPYDVIVCSMVLNCVTTPAARGKMLAKLSRFLNGLAFVTIPKSCLTLSPYLDVSRFTKLLRVVGLEVVESKETPRISFFVCRKLTEPVTWTAEAKSFQRMATVRKGKKYRNDFAVTLSKEDLIGPSKE